MAKDRKPRDCPCSMLCRLTVELMRKFDLTWCAEGFPTRNACIEWLLERYVHNCRRYRLEGDWKRKSRKYSWRVGQRPARPPGRRGTSRPRRSRSSAK